MSYQPIDPYSLKHLQAELTRIDVLIHREIRRWQRAGQDPDDDFRGMYVSHAEALALLARPFGANWGQQGILEPAEGESFADMTARASEDARGLADAARATGQLTRLEHLAQAFELDRFELDALLICLAPTLDLRYERLYAYLQDNINRTRPSVNLVLNLLCQPGMERLQRLAHFADSARLLRYGLLERMPEPGSARPPLLNFALSVEESIVSWLLGVYQPRAELAPYATFASAQANAADELLAADAWPHLAGAAAEQAIIAFFGPDRARQAAAARLFAARSARALLTIDLAGAAAGGLSPMRTLRLALREARLTGVVLCLAGLEAWLVDGALPPALLAELCAHPDVVIVSGAACWQPSGILRERKILWVDFPAPDYARRRALWQHFLGQTAPPDEEGMSALAGQFLLTSDQIRDAVAIAKDTASPTDATLPVPELFAAARAYSNAHLANLARKIVPRYGWADIVLPADQREILHEIIATVRGRPRVLDEWGLGRKLTASDGVTVLFAGPPGTGKTMAAEIIAAELGLDLYKIDLSSIVSKYIGETEKNLERIFREAASSNAILFFDEADALFGKRSEVHDSHDRYANIEVSYLLQRMEAYDGVTILATNLSANLDEAFTRRLQFVIDFPFPDEADRLRIWQTLFPAGVPRANLDLDLLARRYKLAGGNIRNIIVSAAFLAAADGGTVTMEHLLHGTRRELQKMGRMVGEG